MTTTNAALATASGIDCICYLAKDFERAKKFYTTTLGLHPTTEGDAWVEFELSDGATFALAKLPNEAWYPAGGAMFAVPNVREAASHLKDAGVKFFGDVEESPSCNVAWCEDTEGNNFAIHERLPNA